ncbi:MAG: AEC family transporter [Gammaproteobacteria bacterium]|nr:AEC family transporter [Gammaproteobacteria bacterium]
MGIFETVLPILLIVLLGYLAVKTKHLSQTDANSIAKFVFSYVIPLLLFIGTVKAKIPHNMEWEFLFSYYLALVCVFILGVILAKVFFNFNIPQQSVFGIGASYSNATVIGIPVCIYALGEQVMLPLFIIISIHNLVLFTLGVFVAERNSLSLSSILLNTKNLLKQLLTSPITASLIAGGLVNILNIQLYSPLEQAITLISQAAIPAALFVLGTSLNKYKIHGHLAPALVLVILKILIFPLLVWFLAFHVFSINTLWAATALLTSAMPMGISAYIFSQRYQTCEAPIATGIVISTLGSIFTLSVLIAYVQPIL